MKIDYLPYNYFKTLPIIIVLSILFYITTGWSDENALSKKADWDVFSKNLVQAIKHGNEGLKCSAMQLIIKHADSVDVNEAVWDIMAIFKHHENPKVRQLAMVTLYKMKHDWAMFYLKRNLQFESNEAIYKQNRKIVRAYEMEKKAAQEKEPLIAEE